MAAFKHDDKHGAELRMAKEYLRRYPPDHNETGIPEHQNANAVIAAALVDVLETSPSHVEPKLTYHGSGEDLATDVHALLNEKERKRFAVKWQERETYERFGTLLPLGERPKETDAEINSGALRRKFDPHPESAPSTTPQKTLATHITDESLERINDLHKIVRDSARSDYHDAMEKFQNLVGVMWENIYSRCAGTTASTTPLFTLDTAERVCFYEQEFYPMSNFSAFRVNWRGRTFDTSEQAYHWTRFEAAPGYAGCTIHQGNIRHSHSAHEAFKYAQHWKHEQRPDWDAVKVAIMRDLLHAKAAQHEYVRRKLLQTGDRELVENSWRDPYWGWGPNRDGLNMLGKLWMEVRADLRRADGGKQT